ncbi:PREDICTED: transmembrane channel-like protein 8 [Propithecus coquereli]|uniref:transmembrane channel-like protein 8 n=1 Tax=Propithecus coquereli TaxID=379532 RepID=UPI00063FA490|nr:PREDICTED: transmembrane channel-like protein 8 [Propithecus coquereli]XP_012516773.1 PREDICTED: transmembrane channel-like protein 8 [Propithecus coquereli]XP_012516775.1 PREDICTED: transmembrane channel-like protein 8 [Propithecus coquereli]
MLRQWSVQSGQGPGGPELEPAAEGLWESEMERLCASRAAVRTLPYAMADKRFIRQLREPEGVKTSCWQSWQRRRQMAGRRLGEAAQRLARGCGLWEGSLYEIGGLFGTGIQSYFTFLRFLLLLNLLTVLVTAGFVLLPLAWLHPPDPGPAMNLTLQCPSSHQPQTGVPKFHNQLWNVLTGRAFSNTYLFYGAYRVGPESSSAYSIRLAYLLSPLACLLLCFCGTLRRMVKGLPQKPLLDGDYRVPLSSKVFSSWDFCIQVQEAATIKKHAISNEFKMELEESHRFQLVQQQSPAQRACHLLSYLRVNILIGLLVVGAISAIFWATKYSQDNKEESLFVLLQYLPPGVIALVNFLGPLLFVFLVQLENYSPNTEVNLILIWCVVLKLASLGMFSFSLGQTVLCIGRNKTSCEPYGYNACDYQCWENSVGQELYKLSTFNFLLTVAFAFLVSLPRRLLVERFSGRFWTWLDREEFLVPKNVLDIVAAQTVTWMGLFYCPLLPLLNSIFIFLTFYIKKYTLLRNSRASRRLFRASSSTFFFQLVLLLGLLLAVVPLGYVVTSIHSSWDCGLFTNYSAPWQVVPELVALRLPPPGQRALHYLSSHAFSFPLLLTLSLVLTVCVSQSQANARAIRGLRKQLLWQVQEKWHLVEDLSRLLRELDPGEYPCPESPHSRASHRRPFCPGFPCPGSPGPRPPWPGPSLADPGLRSPGPGSRSSETRPQVPPPQWHGAAAP